MLTYLDIQSIINNPEKENSTIELKSFRKLFNEDKKSFGEKRRDLACEIAAIANRHGGKLILGLNDDGTFDGKNVLDLDRVKEIIHQECQHNISPSIDCSTQFLQCPEGDLLIIYIPKRKNIPHAFIVSREGGIIKNRIYYIRTSHGKQLISDTQLEWLFNHQEDPNFSHQFRIAVDFDKHFGIIGKDVNSGVVRISTFLNFLSQKDRDILRNNPEAFYTFLIELFPFFILKSISDYYTHSWYIGINKEFERTSSGPMKADPPVTSSLIEVCELKLPDTSVINNLSWDFKSVLKKIFPKKMHIPPLTEISIDYEKEGKLAKVKLKNQYFNFEILIGMMSSGSGLHQLNPYLQMLQERDPLGAQQYSMSNFYHFDGAGYFNANFEFPEYDVEEFKKHYHYSNTLKELIEDNWNYETIRAQSVSKEVLVIDDKLNDIINILRNDRK